MASVIEHKTDVCMSFLTAREAATYMKMTNKYSYITVQRWARTGLLRGGKRGDEWVFHKEDLDNFIFPKR